MIPSHWRGVLGALVEKTRQGKVDWLTTSDETVFAAEVGPNTVMIDKYRSGASLVAVMTLVDADGHEVDSFRLGTADPDYPTVTELWSMARNTAKGIDATFRSVEDALGNL